MDQHLQTLLTGVNRWRENDISEYWLQVDYIGAALNRMGIHILTASGDDLWHQWHNEWRQIKKGSDFWLYSVPGTFAWARDIITKVLPESEAGADGMEMRINSQYGYIEFLRVKAAKRNAANFTFEVKTFGTGLHTEFEKDK